MQWLVLAAALALSGCAWDTYDPAFAIPATGATTPQEVCRWVDARVVYLADDVHDRTEYWQSPDQTYEWGRGDCEDYVILCLYLIHRDLGGWPALVGGHLGDASHAWVGYEGRWYEAQTGRDVTDDTAYVEELTIEYGEVLWRAENWHCSERWG